MPTDRKCETCECCRKIAYLGRPIYGCGSWFRPLEHKDEHGGIRLDTPACGEWQAKGQEEQNTDGSK